MALTKEYSNALQTLAMRGHEPPKAETLHDYRKFRGWWDVYSKDPEIGANPYEKYTQGFSAKR